MSVKEPLKGGTAYVPPPDDNLLWYKADNERLRGLLLDIRKDGQTSHWHRDIDAAMDASTAPAAAAVDAPKAPEDKT